MIYALIPAAGKSERMGRPKLSLPFRGSTILQTVIECIRRGGVEQILVVIGPHVPELAPLAEGAGAHVLLLNEETADMRETIEKGLDWLDRCFHPESNDCWLLVPADHPTLDESVVRRLLQARQEQPHRSIVIPTFYGKRGHPALIEWKHASGVRSMPAFWGLNRYLREHLNETHEADLGTNGVLIDLDTPDDYTRLLKATDLAKT
jgi:molybdenum cofactor cytidylyltransferase